MRTAPRIVTLLRAAGCGESDADPCRFATDAAATAAAALAAAVSGWFHDAAAHWLWIKLPASVAPIRAEVSP
jgi:hypothetical protein